MQNKKITLTINPKFHELVTQKANDRMMSIQEYIYEAVRDKAFAPPPMKSKAGRPKKNDDAFLDMFSRKR